MRALLLSSNAALGMKVLYCLYPVAECVHVIAADTRSPLRLSRHVRRYETMPFSRDGKPLLETATRVNAYCREHRIDVVVPSDMEAAGFIAVMRNRIDAAATFAVSPAALLHAMHDKWLFGDRLQSAGIATPKTRLVPSLEALSEELAEEVGFPVMAKPLEGESSHGVVRFDDYASLRGHVAGDAPYSAPPLIIQEYIPGTDIDYSAVTIDGQIVAAAVQAWRDSGTLAFSRNADVESLGQEVLRLFDYSGAAHLDMRIDERTGKVLVIECNPRFWFTLPAAMWTGINFVELGIAHACGERRQAPAAEGVYFLPGEVVRSLFLNPRRLASLTVANIRGFLQPVLDPLPHLAAILGS